MAVCRASLPRLLAFCVVSYATIYVMMSSDSVQQQRYSVGHGALRRGALSHADDDSSSHFARIGARPGDFNSLFYNTSIETELAQSFQGTPFRPLRNFQSPCWLAAVSGQNETLRCMPAAYLMGFAKSGTSDIHHSLNMHPAIFGGRRKECHYWDFRRLAYWDVPVEPDSFSAFVDHFERASRGIVELGNGCKSARCHHVKNDTYYRGVTIDGTPSYMHMYAGWERIPANVGLEEPRLTLAHTLHRLNKDTKFVIALRDPVDRSYSQFRHFVANESAEVFHELMVRGIEAWKGCLREHTRRACAFNYSLIPCDRLNKCGVYLRASMYPIYLREWLSVFDMKQFHFVKSEEYFQKRGPVVRQIFSFLNVSDVNSKIYRDIESSGVRNNRKGKSRVRQEPMLPKTIRLLRQFFRPFVHELAAMLGDSKYLWDYDD